MHFRQLPLLALLIGIVLFFILVSCDEDAPGSSAWNYDSKARQLP